MKKDLCEIVCIVDKSGSMDSVKDDAIGGFNSFIETQMKLPGKAFFTFYLFDTEKKEICSGIPIEDIKKLNEETYVPGGMTALLDAVGTAIDSVGSRLQKMPEEERPEKVIVAILTDGQENSSKEYTQEQVKEMIETQQEKFNWDFVYISASPTAWEDSGSIGISAGDTIQYAATNVGTRNSYAELSKSVTSSRSS